LPDTTPSYQPFAETPPWPQELWRTAETERIAPASVAALIQHITDVQRDKTTNPYKLAREIGLSSSEAHCHPATGPYLAIIDYLDANLASAGATSAGASG
jgi:hypothetical protein